jgi:hypothetical protein
MPISLSMDSLSLLLVIVVFDLQHQESPAARRLPIARRAVSTYNEPAVRGDFLVSEKAIGTAPGMSRRGTTEIGDMRRWCDVMLMPFSSASLMPCVVM